MSTDISTEIKNRGYEMVIFNALKSSIYPGAKDESILMALDYCKAMSLNPMLKPGHLVPMKVKNPVSGAYEWRDVYMPGIAEYRIRAARSSEYAGVTEPEYGEEVTEKLGGKDFTYPAWCKVTVKKFVNGKIAEFSAKEYWKENYATGKDTTYPNSMWAKRPYGQIAKCAEAQALRKAFPELLGGQPTAEEMEGKIHWVNDEAEDKNKKLAKGNEGLKDVLGLAPKTEEVIEQVDIETGEVIDEIADIRDKLEMAQTAEEIVDCYNRIQNLHDCDAKTKKELSALYTTKRNEIEVKLKANG